MSSGSRNCNGAFFYRRSRHKPLGAENARPNTTWRTGRSRRWCSARSQLQGDFRHSAAVVVWFTMISILKGVMTSNRFNSFVEFVEFYLSRMQWTSHIFDNVPCHSKADQEANNGVPRIPRNHFTQRLPSNSPFLNIVKRPVPRHLEVREQLLLESQPRRLVILTQLPDLSTSFLPKSFTRTQSYMPQCIEKQLILM